MLEDDSFKRVLIKHLSKSITLVIALAWNSAIKQIISEIPILRSHGLIVYAFVLTILGVMAIKVMDKADKFLERELKLS